MYMKGSIVRGVLVFMAGAGCATVVAQVVGDPYPPTSIEEWQKKATELLPKVAELGYYVERTSDGTVGIRLDPIECGPKPPVPKVPEHAVDPRTLRPLDTALITANVRKTNRCVVVHEHWPYGGPGAEIVDRIQREAFDFLDAPVLRVSNLDVPMPYAAHLENEVIVTPERVRDALNKVLYRAS